MSSATNRSSISPTEALNVLLAPIFGAEDLIEDGVASRVDEMLPAIDGEAERRNR